MLVNSSTKFPSASNTNAFALDKSNTNTSVNVLASEFSIVKLAPANVTSPTPPGNGSVVEVSPFGLTVKLTSTVVVNVAESFT